MVIRCAGCGAKLGQQIAGHLIVMHHRRELIIDLPAHVVQRCDNCGALNVMGECAPPVEIRAALAAPEPVHTDEP